MSRKAIKFKHQLKLFFHYFQRRYLINSPDSLYPQWSRQAVITGLPLDLEDYKIKWSRNQYFLV